MMVELVGCISFSYLFEALSYALLKAMLKGVPSVMIHNGINGFTCDHPDEYVNAILSLLNDPAEARAFWRSTKQYVLDHHNLKKNTQKLKEIYGQFGEM